MSPLKTKSSHLTNMKLFHYTFIPLCVFHAVPEMSKFESQILCVFSSHNIHIHDIRFPLVLHVRLLYSDSDDRRTNVKQRIENELLFHRDCKANGLILKNNKIVPVEESGRSFVRVSFLRVIQLKGTKRYEYLSKSFVGACCPAAQIT